MRRAALALVALVVALALACLTPTHARADGLLGDSGLIQRIRDAAADLRERRRDTALALMGYGMTPDGSASAVQFNRGTRTDGSADTRLSMGQLGSGFTVSPSFPVFLEGYLGYARYDPRFVESGGDSASRLPLRWNNVSVTTGVGYDIRLARNLYLRPILNAGAGISASDATLFRSYLAWRFDREVDFLNRTQLNAWAAGGSLVLAYYDYRPARDIDIELRYTHLHLQTFGGTAAALRGNLEAKTLTLWGRYRWPTGVEVFGGPVRWVTEANASAILGDQRRGVAFEWMTKWGGGLELDIARHGIGALGLYATRVRVLGRYLYGDNSVRGVSFGLGVSF